MSIFLRFYVYFMDFFFFCVYFSYYYNVLKSYKNLGHDYVLNINYVLK